jgi:hypothetical protein
LRGKTDTADLPVRALQGFWLPPVNGRVDTLDVTCPHCDETATYDLISTAQNVSCKACSRTILLPGQIEVVRAAVALTVTAAPSDRVSSTQLSREPLAAKVSQRAVKPVANNPASIEAANRFHDPQLSVPQFSEISNAPARARRKPTRPSPISLLLLVVGSLIGLFAGYFVLCVIDIRYDFLHLIAEESSTAEQKVIDAKLLGNARPEPLPDDGQRARPERPGIAVQRVPPGMDRNPNDQPPQKHQRFVPRNQRQPEVDGADDRNLGEELKEQQLGFQRPRAVDPFVAKLPLCFSLPVPPKVGQPTRLTDVPLGELDNFEMEVIGDVNRQVELTLSRLSQDDAPWTWRVDWLKDNSIEIARFSIVNDVLEFEWLAIPPGEAVATLRNSIVKIRANNLDHFVTLRKPKVIAPVTVDLNKNVDRIICDCDDFPDEVQLRLDATPVDFPPYDTQGTELRGLKLNDERILTYNGAKSAATRIRFTVFKGNPAIELETRYRLPSGDEDTLNIRRGNRKIQNMQKSLALRNDPILRRDFDALEEVADVATELHERARIQYRVYVNVNEHEVELLTTQ